MLLNTHLAETIHSTQIAIAGSKQSKTIGTRGFYQSVKILFELSIKKKQFSSYARSRFFVKKSSDNHLLIGLDMMHKK